MTLWMHLAELHGRCIRTLHQFISLQMAIMELSKLSKQWDIEFVLCGHLVAMLAFLRLYVSDKCMGWHAASQIAATVAGKGVGLACSI